MSIPAVISVTAEPPIELPESPSAVELRAVSYSYGSRKHELPAIRDLTLTVEPGQFVSIIGPSGCGKSTLLKIVAGLLKPTQGEVCVQGQTVDGPSRQVGLMFQRPVLLPWRNVLDNVLFPLDARGQDRRPYIERAHALLGQVGLRGFERRYAAELSVGMQQRVSLCRALLCEAPLLLMDEPFAALDALTRDRADVELARVTRASGATVVFVTHSIQEAVLLSSRVCVLSPRPARLLQTVDIVRPRPRELAFQEEPEFGMMVGQLRSHLGSAGA